MRSYEPWRALRSLEVPDGARSRLLAGIEARRTRSGRRGYLVAGVAAAAAIALFFVLRPSGPSQDAAPTRAAAPGAATATPGAATATPGAATAGADRPPATTGARASTGAGAPRETAAAPADGLARALDVTATPASDSAPGAVAADASPAPGPSSEPKPRVPARSSRSRSRFANSEQRASPEVSRDELDLARSSLREQVRAFRAARAKAPVAALPAWKEHRRRWPASTLRREVDLAIIDALRALGRTVEARGEAAAFVRAHPGDRRSSALRRFAEAR